MAASSSQFPRDMLEQHLRIEESLRALANSYVHCSADPRSRFFGQTRDEFDDCLRQTADEQDDQTVLMLAASCEAVVRRDFRARVARPRNRRNAPDADFIALDRENPERTRLDDILEVWRKLGVNIRELRHLFKRRHWLAHGRYWSDKSGYAAEPRMVFSVIEAVFGEITACVSDFPRSW